jgi:PBP1b-binding outer membrane lipoprotein LpoB
MKSPLSVLAISALLLTGCSTPSPESKPEYDEVELMVYQACIEKNLDGLLQNKRYFKIIESADMLTAKAFCKDLKPEKK